jgi:LPXTG-motif cell wall-anchored protein
MHLAEALHWAMREGKTRPPTQPMKERWPEQEEEQVEQAKRFALSAGAVLAGLGTYFLTRKKRNDEE